MKSFTGQPRYHQIYKCHNGALCHSESQQLCLSRWTGTIRWACMTCSRSIDPGTSTRPLLKNIPHCSVDSTCMMCSRSTDPGTSTVSLLKEVPHCSVDSTVVFY